MESLSIVGITTGIAGILIAIYTHVKYSKCLGFEIQTYSPNELQSQPQITINSQPNTPETNHKELTHSQETNL